MEATDLIAELKRLAENYFDYMEGCDGEEFHKWESMYCAASLLAEEIEKEGNK